ncbi:MAG TPA: carboxypeptidase-like regulatory domain-containing protein [Candidatus Angelobacter sp.]
MSPTKLSAAQWAFWGTIIAAVITAAALIYVHSKADGTTKYVSGTVTDAQSGRTLPSVVVKLQTDDGKDLRQDTTDGEGKYSLEVPNNLTSIRLAVTAAGYPPYDQKLPASAGKNDIRLERQPITFAIPDGIQLDRAMQIVAEKLNVTAVFAKSCNKRAQSAFVNSTELRGNPTMPEPILKTLLSTVKNNSLHYNIRALEPGTRYEINCV